MTYYWANPRGLPTSRLRPKVRFGASRRHMLVHVISATRAVWKNNRLAVQAAWQCGDGGEDVILLADAKEGGSTCARCADITAGPAVYRCFDASGDLLYIGSTTRLEARLAVHRTQSSWWSDVARVTHERFADLTAARLVEGRAIRSEQPRHNKVGNERGRTHGVPA